MLQIKSFAGGLNLQGSNNRPDQTIDCLNFTIDLDGGLKTREGYYRIETATSEIGKVFKLKTNFTDELLHIRTSGGLYRGSDLLSSTVTSDAHLNVFNDTCVISSKNFDPLIYSGSFGTVKPMSFKDEDGIAKSAIRFSGTQTHKQRLFGFREDEAILFFSELGYMDRWDGNGFIGVDHYDSGSIVRLEPQYDSLVIYKTTGVWVLYGTTESDFEVRNVVKTKSLIGPNALLNVDNIHFFVDKDEGVVAFDGTSFTPVSVAIDPELRLYIDRNTTLAYKDKKIYVFTNKYTYVYDLLLKVWTRHSITASHAITIWDGNIYFAKGSNIYAMGGSTDDGYPISANWKTGCLDCGSSTIIKDFESISLVNGSVADGLTVEYDIDNAEFNGSLVTQSRPGTSKWGAFVWGSDKWTIPLADVSTHSLSGMAYGVGISVNVKATGPSTVKGLLVDYKPRRKV